MKCDTSHVPCQIERILVRPAHAISWKWQSTCQTEIGTRLWHEWYEETPRVTHGHGVDNYGVGPAVRDLPLVEGPLFMDEGLILSRMISINPTSH